MDHQEEKPLESAATYYDTKRKRSFLYSRITVVVSMVILVAVLAFNVNVLYSDKTALQSRASEHPNTNNLPKLPKGCEYQPLNNGFQVVCETPTPAQAVAPTTSASAIAVKLPQLPPACSLQTFEGGNRIICTTGVPIPTVQVPLPANCVTTTQANTVSCVANNQKILNPLPSLPGGCSYKQIGSQYFVVCTPSTK